MDARTMLAASLGACALLLLQFGLIVLRNQVRSRLFSPSRTLPPVAAALRVPTRGASNPEPEE